MKIWIEIMLVLAVCLAVIYGSLLIFFIRGWGRLHTRPYNIPVNPGLLSVIIAARNEEKNIEKCLAALRAQDLSTVYFEVIVVDDHSEDSTAEKVKKICGENPGTRLISLEDGICGKKNAITAGIKEARGELIVLTDADCTMDAGWLRHISSFYETYRPKMILVPVFYKGSKKIFEKLQELEFFSLQAVSAAAAAQQKPLMCNGAGLAYEKKIFETLSGFSGHQHLASGDDVMLMHKINAAYPGSVMFLTDKQSAVKTNPAESIRDFFDQRVRWASKAKYYSDKFTQYVSLIVLLAAIIPFLTVVSGLITGSWKIILAGLSLFIFKSLFDFLFLLLAAKSYDKIHLLAWFIPVQLLYPFYAGAVAVMTLPRFYKWKGRNYRQQ